MVRISTFFKLALFILFLIPESLLANQTPLRIMALGNSITQADANHYSYRYNLWKKLTDAKIEVDFVGSHATNYNGNPDWPKHKGKSFDPDNEGHWGWSADQVLHGNSNEPGKGKLSQWLQGYTPDIVLLHLGTNDMFRNQPIQETFDELREVIKQLRNDNPKVTIFLAQLIPAYDQKVGAQISNNIKQFNEQLPGLATELHKDASPVILVNHYHGFNATTGVDTYDGVHPNASGEEKMATRWFDAIMQVAAPSEMVLQNFDANETEQGHIALNWQTASESKSSHFEIERAVNSDDFQKIGKVDGAGHSNKTINYSFSDESAPHGNLYYRLKHIGLDGKHGYSEIEHVKKEQVLSAADEKAAKDNMQVYPTATRQKNVTIAVNNLKPYTNLEIHIYNVEGKLVEQIVSSSNADGSLTTEVALQQTLRSGLYFVHVITKQERLQKELILL